MLKHTKRYAIILQTWNYKDYRNVAETYSVDEFDTKEQVDDASNLIVDMYYKATRPSEISLQINPNSYYWGYVILDFETKTIVSICHDGLKDYPGLKDSKDNLTYLRLMDDMFRDESEVPAGYEWQDGEYEGWLQYRWGNGKNAMNANGVRQTAPDVRNIMFRSRIPSKSPVHIQKIKEPVKTGKKRLPSMVKEEAF